jgi:hypothetical protein
MDDKKAEWARELAEIKSALARAEDVLNRARARVKPVLPEDDALVKWRSMMPLLEEQPKEKSFALTDAQIKRRFENHQRTLDACAAWNKALLDRVDALEARSAALEAADANTWERTIELLSGVVEDVSTLWAKSLDQLKEECGQDLAQEVKALRLEITALQDTLAEVKRIGADRGVVDLSNLRAARN